MVALYEVIQTKAIEFDEALPAPLLALLKTILDKVICLSIYLDVYFYMCVYLSFYISLSIHKKTPPSRTLR